MKASPVFLIAMWIIYVALLGPFLISARDTMLVTVGLAILVGLCWLTWGLVKPFFQKEETK